MQPAQAGTGPPIGIGRIPKELIATRLPPFAAAHRSAIMFSVFAKADWGVGDLGHKTWP